MHNKIYEINHDRSERNSPAFVGYDDNGVARPWTKSGSIKSDVWSGNTNEMKKAKTFLVCRCMSEDFSGRKKVLNQKVWIFYCRLHD